MDSSQKKIANKILARRKQLEKLNDWSFWNPPEDIKPSEWLKKNVVVPRKVSGARAGLLRLEPWWTTIIDEMGNARTAEITIMSASQTGKSFSAVLMCIYALFAKDSPVFVIASDEKLAKDILDGRARELANASPFLASKVRLKGGREQRDRLYGETADIRCGTANSPSSLSSIAAQVILADEVSLYAESLGDNVDAINLVQQRLKSYAGCSKAIFASTPLLKGDIFDRQFNKGIIYRWYLVCPNPECGKHSKVDFDRIDYPHNETPKYIEDHPECLSYVCEFCKVGFPEKQFKTVARKGCWIADEGQEGKSVRSVSYAVPGLLSTIETWTTAVVKMLEAGKKPKDLQSHYNYCQGKTWEDKREAIRFEELESCISNRYKTGEIPEGCIGLLLGVDTGGTPGSGDGIEPDEQGKCLKFQTTTLAILPGGETHVVDSREFANWKDLWDGYALKQTFFCPDNGAEYDFCGAFVDSGGTAKKFGYTTTQAIYALSHECRFTPLKGTPELTSLESFRYSKIDHSKKGFGYIQHHSKQIDLLQVNTNYWKSYLHGLIRAGMFTMPSDYVATDKKSHGYDFQKQLTNEVVGSKKNKQGVPQEVWVVKRENLPTHYLDSTCYAHCGAATQGLFNYRTWDQYVSEKGYPWINGPAPKEGEKAEPQQPTPAPYQPPSQNPYSPW